MSIFPSSPTVDERHLRNGSKRMTHPRKQTRCLDHDADGQNALQIAFLIAMPSSKQRSQKAGYLNLGVAEVLWTPHIAPLY